ncbi:MAG TPA: condensation domain-containing protein, partial [Candidatus Sulfotelmatobacter sp.]|nr:condensation domain-containing protein [Candidatus Sulfotelmatobacter sp.]
MSTAANTPTPSAMQSKRALLAERLRLAASAHRRRPLSFAQQRLWFLDQLEPNSPLYNIATVARLIGNLDASALEQALNAVIARHEALRTRFICPEENPVQEIAQQVRLHLRRVDLRGSPETERTAQLKQRIREEVNRPFNLGQDQLVRATLLQLKPAEHILVLIIHHIVADEWSLKILFHELAACYEEYRQGTPVTLPELPIQYADYAVWQRDWLQGPVLEQHLAFWRAQLGGNPPITELPTDRPRRPAPSFRGGNQARALSRELSKALQQLANAQQSTLFMVLLAAFKALLYRYTQQEDIIIGSPIAGRNRVETEGLVGFFVNTLPLRTRLEGNLTFEQLLARVREGTLGAYAHQDLPFEKLVEELQPERSLDHMPFAKLMFVVQNSLLEEMQWDGVKVQFLEVESDTAKFDATLVWQETSRGLVARVEYNSDLFEPATIGRLLQHLEMLLKGIV